MASKVKKLLIAWNKFEQKLNRKIKHILNCDQFIELVKKKIEIHVDRVEIQRAYMKMWLNTKGYTNKDEITNITKKYISIEAKADELEDSMYMMVQNWNSKNQTIVIYKKALNELKELMKEELIEDREGD